MSRMRRRLAMKLEAKWSIQIPLHRSNLQSVDSQCALDPNQIEIVGAKNLQIAQLVSQTQLMVSLKLVPVAGPTDTLKVFTAVWIANSQSMDESRRHNVIDVPGYSLLEIYSAGSDFAPPM
jgi:hypothetical protein